MSQNCFSLNNAWNSIGCDVNFKVTSQFSICEDNLNHLLYPCVPLCHEWARHIGGNVTDTFFFFIMLHFIRSCPWPSNLLSWQTLASTVFVNWDRIIRRKMLSWKHTRRITAFSAKTVKKKGMIILIVILKKVILLESIRNSVKLTGNITQHQTSNT